MQVIKPQQELIQRIRAGENSAIKELYELAFRYCASFVLKNKGTMDDAKDIFQETLFAFIKKLRDDSFQIDHDLKAFLYTINRNLWLKRLRGDKNTGLNLILDEPETPLQLIAEDQIEEKKELEAKDQQLYDHLKKLKGDCQRLLRLTFFKKKDDHAIAEMMEYSYGFVRQKRKRCLKTLRESMAA